MTNLLAALTILKREETKAFRKECILDRHKNIPKHLKLINFSPNSFWKWKSRKVLVLKAWYYYLPQILMCMLDQVSVNQFYKLKTSKNFNQRVSRLLERPDIKVLRKINKIQLKQKIKLL